MSAGGSYFAGVAEPLTAAERKALSPYNSGLPEARQAQPFDLAPWKQWEGQTIDAEFLLERCIGGSSRGAVFETQFQGRPAAIKLIPGAGPSITALLALWKKAASLSHAALVQTLAHGQMPLGETPCAYIVMERAEENLADVLAERVLAPSETRDMLLPVLGALQYLDAEGFSHGRLKPANIMAFGDQVKISSDSLVAARDSASDCRAVGVLISEVLGTHVPEPFAEIVKGCLTPDPVARWNVARIQTCLRERTGDLVTATPASRTRSRIIGWGLAAAAAVTLSMFAIWPTGFAIWPTHRESLASNAGKPAPRQPVATTPAAAEEKPSAGVNPSVAAKPPAEAKPSTEVKPPAKEVKEAKEDTAAKTSDGITQVLPDISQQALGTITGRVRINVRVHVDGAGSVNQATLQPPAASKYFTDRVLAAAQAWKFPAGNDSDWVLHFELLRTQMRVSPEKITN